MTMIYKPYNEMKINNYTVLQFKELPTSPYRRIRIEGKIYEIVPSYDMKNCIVINSNASFLNKETEFII